MIPGLSAIVSGLGMGLNMFSSYKQQKAQNKSLDINAAIARRNAGEANRQAGNAWSRGKQQVGAIYRGRDQIIGDQQQGLSSSGVSVNSGSAFDVAIDSRRQAANDADTTYSNAREEVNSNWAKARDFLYQSENLEAQKQSPWMQAGLTGLGQGAGLFNKWQVQKNQYAQQGALLDLQKGHFSNMEEIARNR